MRWVRILILGFLSLEVFLSSSWAMTENEEEGPSSAASRVVGNAGQKASDFRIQVDTRIPTNSVFFYGHLEKLSSELRQLPAPSIFISYSEDNKRHQTRVETLVNDLLKAGIPVQKILFDQWWNRAGASADIFEPADRIRDADKVIVVGSPGLKTKYNGRIGTISQEINALRMRITGERKTEGIIPVWFEGNHEDAFPDGLQTIFPRFLGENYFVNFFELLRDIYQMHLDPNANPIYTLQQRFIATCEALSPEMIRDYEQRLLEYQEEKAEIMRTTAITMLDTYLKALKAELRAIPMIRETPLQNEHFIGRQRYLECLKDNFEQRKFYSVLTGMKGIGKTQIAKAYAYNFIEGRAFLYDWHYDLIWWFNASFNADPPLEEQYKNFCEQWNAELKYWNSNLLEEKKSSPFYQQTILYNILKVL